MSDLSFFRNNNFSFIWNIYLLSIRHYYIKRSSVRYKLFSFLYIYICNKFIRCCLYKISFLCSIVVWVIYSSASSSSFIWISSLIFWRYYSSKLISVLEYYCRKWFKVFSTIIRNNLFFYWIVYYWAFCKIYSSFTSKFTFNFFLDYSSSTDVLYLCLLYFIFWGCDWEYRFT